MNLRNLFELKNLLDSVPCLDYSIEGNCLFVYYQHDDTVTEFIFTLEVDNV